MSKIWPQVSLLVVATICFTLAFVIKKQQPNVVDLYIQYIEVKTPQDLNQKKKILADLDYVSQHFSSNIIEFLGDAVRKSDKRNNSDRHKVELSGFEDIGVDSKMLAELWSQKYYPKSWIENNIKSIRFQNKSKKFSENSGMYGLEGYMAGETRSFTYNIILFGDSAFPSQENTKATKRNLDWVFSHELGHLNDWIDAPYLTAKDRLDFLVEVTKAFHQPDAFVPFGGYVKSIKDRDSQRQKYYQVNEWWAEVCEYYFTFPDILQRESANDFYLVDKWVKKQDPSFNTFLKKSERYKFFKEKVLR